MDHEEIVLQALAAIEAGDASRLKILLHPYVHWSDAAGKLRGRTCAIAHLTRTRASVPPDRYELRDGQIYRWTAGDS